MGGYGGLDPYPGFGARAQNHWSNDQNIMAQQNSMGQASNAAQIQALMYRQKEPEKKEEVKMGTSYVREYFLKHRELLMGLAICILIDRYVFDGAFSEKLKKIVHSFLDGAEQKLVKGPEVT